MSTLPKVAGDFTPQWLNAVLSEGGHLGDYQVTDCEIVDLDIPGQTAEIARLQLTYDKPDCPLPARMIAKYTSRNPQIRELVQVYGQYWRETSFYQNFPDVGIPTPTCYYAHHEPDEQTLMILMQDLAPAESPSWASTPEQVQQAVSHLPAFHAKWWNDPALKQQDWLVQSDNVDFYRAAADAAQAAIPGVREVFGISTDATVAVLDFWARHIDTLIRHIQSRPFTLVHGDYHAKQLFFPSQAGGDFAVIDWQFSFVAQGAWDLIRIFAVGQDTDSRLACQQDTFERYLNGLHKHGVTDYTIADLLDDVRIGLVVNQMIFAIALVDTDISLLEKECVDLGVDYRDLLLLRGDKAMVELGTLEYLQSIVDNA